MKRVSEVITFVYMYFFMKTYEKKNMECPQIKPSLLFFMKQNMYHLYHL